MSVSEKVTTATAATAAATAAAAAAATAAAAAAASELLVLTVCSKIQMIFLVLSVHGKDYQFFYFKSSSKLR